MFGVGIGRPGLRHDHELSQHSGVDPLTDRSSRHSVAGTRVEVREITSPDSSRMLVVTTLVE